MPTCLAIGRTTTTPPADRTLPEEQHRSAVLYEDIVRPACEQLGLTFLRADRLAEAGLPADQLLRMVTEVDVVVADLSGVSDPQLSFGLGVRHALGRCTVQLTEGTDRFPSAGTNPRIPFPSHPDGAVSACRTLTRVMATEVLREDRPSPLPPLPAGSPPQSAQQTVAEANEDGPGLFDLVIEAEAHLEALSDDMADMEAALTDLGEMMGLLGEDMASVGHPGASTSAKMAVLNRLAKAIDGPTDDLEAAAARLAEHMNAGLGAFRAFLDWVADMPRAEWPEGAAEVLEQFAATSFEVQSAASAVDEAVTLIEMCAAVSRQLRRPARRIIKAIRTVLQTGTLLEELHVRAVQLKVS
ncbi:hypothetical protein ACPCI1_25400 [Streptomyces seoulensis]|uniref:hypothetical protein n=1 Tax=Streptomyces seoulensis TaxID=73044 RepID=UPI003C2DCF75